GAVHKTIEFLVCLIQLDISFLELKGIVMTEADEKVHAHGRCRQRDRNINYHVEEDHLFGVLTRWNERNIVKACEYEQCVGEYGKEYCVKPFVIGEDGKSCNRIRHEEHHSTCCPRFAGRKHINGDVDREKQDIVGGRMVTRAMRVN